jgi:hypothetical protein
MESGRPRLQTRNQTRDTSSRLRSTVPAGGQSHRWGLGSADDETEFAIGGFQAGVSAFALMVEKPLKSARDLARFGTIPHRIATISRPPVSRFLRITGCMVVGAPANWKGRCSGRIATGSGKPPILCLSLR